MNELDDLSKDLLSINLYADPIDKINEFYQRRLEILMGLMATETRLCDDIGEGVVEEFGFKGTWNDVYYQLSRELEKIKETPYTDKDKPELGERAIRFTIYLNKRDENPIRKKIKDIFFTCYGNGDKGASDLIESLQSQYLRSRDNLHEKGECICGCNY